MLRIKEWSEIPNVYTGIVEYPNGSKEWRLNGIRHRVDGPAVEGFTGYKAWYLNGEYHREDGPAIIEVDGSKSWYKNGLVHREGGPAVEYGGAHREWWLNNKLHREDGPAVEYSNGLKEWYLNGKFLFTLPPESQPFILLEEFTDEEMLKIKVLTQEGTEIWPNLPGLKELAENWGKNNASDKG